MGKLVYIMGKSGTGKSRSMREIPASEFALINPEGKDLPFGKDAPAFRVESTVTDNSSEIVRQMQMYGRKYSIVVVDDFQTVMTNEYMKRSAESGYQKWTDIGKHAWEIAEAVKKLPDDTIVYILCHTEENENGGEKIKTLGKLLDQNVVLESKSTIVLKTAVVDGKYYFCTQNSGKDTVKSPEGMFPSYAIPNDLKYVDDAIRNYYGMAGAKSDSEMAEEHQVASQDVPKPAAGRKPRRKKEEAQEEEPAKTLEEKTLEEKTLEEKTVAQMEAVAEAAGDRDEIPFEEAMDAISEAEKKTEEKQESLEDNMNPPEAPKPRRRRVRTAE